MRKSTRYAPFGHGGIDMHVITDLAGIAAITIATFAVVIGGLLLAAVMIRMAIS